MTAEPEQTGNRAAQPGGPRTWGARARLGLIVPTTNTVNEAEWAAMCMDGVTVHTARMALHALGEDDNPQALPEVLREAMSQLTDAGPTAIAYSCTAGSMVTPANSLPNAMSDYAGLPCTSTAAAIVAALEALGATRVAVASPYTETMNAQWQSFLLDCGFTVSAISGMGIGAGGPAEFRQIALLPPERIRALATQTLARGPADVLLLSCTDLPTLPLIPELEASLGVPVISSNTATLWQTLKLAGVTPDVADAGVLLRRANGE